MIGWGLMDIAFILLILWFIGQIYYKRYGKTAYLYIRCQLELMLSYCMSLVVTLYVYYWLEARLHIDEKYTEGIILTLFFGLAGYIGRVIYKRVFHNQKAIYKPTKEEYLFITEIAFVAVTIKMISEGIIGPVIPIAVLLGRMMWIDTESMGEILNSIKVGHYRIIESSILLIIGVTLISYIMNTFHLIRVGQIILALMYGLIITGPLEKIRERMRKRKS